MSARKRRKTAELRDPPVGELPSAAPRDPPFSYLPPDVIVSGILPHVEFSGPFYFKLEGVSRFGRFIRDGLRFPWFVFRNVDIESEVIFDCINYLALHKPDYKRFLNEKLPLVRHKHIRQLKLTKLLELGAIFHEHILSPFYRSYMYSSGSRIRTYDKFEKRVFGLVAILAQKNMPLLSSVGGYMWSILKHHELLQNFPNIRMIDFYGYGGWNVSDILPEGTFDNVKGIFSLSPYSRDLRGELTDDQIIERLFTTFPKLDQLTYITEYMPPVRQVIGGKFASILRNKNPRLLQTMCFGNVLVLDTTSHRWTRMITKKLCVTAESADVLVPVTSPNLLTLGLRHFHIKSDYGTPHKVVFESCTFLESTVTLSERTLIAKFEGLCWWPTNPDTGNMLVTVLSNTLVKLIWKVKSDYETVTFRLPNLKEAFIAIYDNDAQEEITIESNEPLAFLTVHYFNPMYYATRTVVNAIADVLTLRAGYPNLKRLENSVKKLRIIDPVSLRFLNVQVGYEFTKLEKVRIKYGYVDVPGTHLVDAFGIHDIVVEDEEGTRYPKG